MITKTQLQEELEGDFIDVQILRHNNLRHVSEDATIVTQSAFKRTWISLFISYLLSATYDTKHNILYILNNETLTEIKNIGFLIHYLSYHRKPVNKIIYLYRRNDGIVMSNVLYTSTSVYTDDEFTRLENEDYYSLIK